MTAYFTVTYQPNGEESSVINSIVVPAEILIDNHREGERGRNSGRKIITLEWIVFSVSVKAAQETKMI